MIGSRFYGLSWFGITTIASGVFGIPVGFLTIYIVSLLTAAPTKEMQDLVENVRYPKTGWRLRGDQRRSLSRIAGGAEGGLHPAAVLPYHHDPECSTTSSRCSGCSRSWC